MPAEQQQANASLSQAQYKETPYEDQSWEIVGTIEEHNEFVPMTINVLPRHMVMTDPMFRDFGGMSSAALHQRMHLPGHIAQDGKAAQADPDAGKVKIFPQELKALKRQSYDEGQRAGAARGEEESAAKLQAMQKSIQGVLQDLAQQLSQNLRSVEKNALDLALAVAEKMIGYAVEINPEYIGQLVHEALTHAGSAVVKRVRVSPQDMEFIEVVGIPKRLLEVDGGWRFEKDASIRAGCVVETSAGEIDFRIDQAWERLKDSVMKAAR